MQERLWFDVKETYVPKSQAEKAKDVAAFANALGGALIVGAREGAAEPDYSTPLPAHFAAEVEHEFDQAIRDFCRPSPTVHIRSIEAPSSGGKIVLVVNIEPAVDQPVAARHQEHKDMWRFPLRVGRHTEYITPEQLPLHMNSKARRAKLLLLRVLESDGDIDLFMVPCGSSRHASIQGSASFKLVSVDDRGGGGLVMRDTDGAFDGQSVTIPIDEVEAVWLQHTGRWAVRIAGRLEQFEPIDRNNTGGLVYTPPTTFVVSPLGRVVEDLSRRVREISQVLKGTLAVQHHQRAEPGHEEIAKRAYARWLWRSERQIQGTAEADWLQARREIIAQRREG